MMMSTDKRRIAKDLLGMAREVLGYEFPSQNALDKYLKEHPKAKKENHWVEGKKPEKNLQKTEKTKTEEKSEDFGGKFRVPESKMLKFEMPGDLGDIGKWKAKILLGNSMGKEQKKGDMDDVGYVAISTVNDEIVPIARADEHRSGYELLYHLQDKDVIRGRPQDFITLSDGTNYPHYTTKDTGMYAKAIKKWLEYGGKNVAVHSQGGDGNGPEKHYVTDMEEYAALDGKMPYGQKGPSKAGREIIEHLEGAMGSLRDGKNKEAMEHAKVLADRLDNFSMYTAGWMEAKEFKEVVGKAENDGDVTGLGKAVQGVAKAMMDKLKRERSLPYSYVSGLYGTGDDVDKRLEKAVGAGVEAQKEDESSGISDTGQNVVGHLEKAAKAVTQGLDMPGTRGGGFDSVSEAAMGLVNELQPMVEDIEGLGSGLEMVQRAVDSGDGDKLQQALFSFNGVKNLLHQRLRKMVKDGVVKDKHFGDVKSAIGEFDRLGQI